MKAHNLSATVRLFFSLVTAGSCKRVIGPRLTSVPCNLLFRVHLISIHPNSSPHNLYEKKVATVAANNPPSLAAGLLYSLMFSVFSNPKFVRVSCSVQSAIFIKEASFLTKLCHFAPLPPKGGEGGKMAELRYIIISAWSAVPAQNPCLTKDRSIVIIFSASQDKHWQTSHFQRGTLKYSVIEVWGLFRFFCQPTCRSRKRQWLVMGVVFHPVS